MNDLDNRLYAAHLLNRVTPDHFDYEDVAVIARLIPLIEADIAAMLNLDADQVDRCHSVADRIGQGMHRPDLPGTHTPGPAEGTAQ